MTKSGKKAFIDIDIDIDNLSSRCQTLFANIRFSSVEKPVKTITVTSSDADEGKTTTSVGLACAMAKAGKRVLLIDGDMRRRSLGKMMKIHSKAGIFSVLSGQSSLKQAITFTGISNLYLLDCESKIANPSDLLSTKRFAALLATLRNSFDYVIIDTPPLSLFVDAAVSATQTDGTIMVVRQRKSKRKLVAQALSQLEAANARVLGIVLTFTQKGDDYYYDNYKYHDTEKDTQTDVAFSSQREFDEEDLTAWAKRVGIGLDPQYMGKASASSPAERPRRSSHATDPGRAGRAASHGAASSFNSEAAASAGKASDARLNRETASSDNPYAPGAFKNN